MYKARWGISFLPNYAGAAIDDAYIVFFRFQPLRKIPNFGVRKGGAHAFAQGPCAPPLRMRKPCAEGLAQLFFHIKQRIGEKI